MKRRLTRGVSVGREALFVVAAEEWTDALLSL